MEATVKLKITEGGDICKIIGLKEEEIDRVVGNPEIESYFDFYNNTNDARFKVFFFSSWEHLLYL